tara:strand:- start:125 stop:394 length:270 start_codon:yes stop_codon:yes gene_type:complete
MQEFNQKVYPIYKNDIGVMEIRIGTKNFMCMGVSPPMDHPHVYLTMGDDGTKICPYCSTTFIYDDTLTFRYTNPPECYAGDNIIGNDAK